MIDPTEREKKSNRYKRSRDYSLLLEYPPFVRFIEEVGEMNASVVFTLTHTDKPELNEHDALVRVRYFNALLGKLKEAAKLEPTLKQGLEDMGVTT